MRLDKLDLRLLNMLQKDSSMQLIKPAYNLHVSHTRLSQPGDVARKLAVPDAISEMYMTHVYGNLFLKVRTKVQPRNVDPACDQGCN